MAKTKKGKGGKGKGYRSFNRCEDGCLYRRVARQMFRGSSALWLTGANPRSRRL